MVVVKSAVAATNGFSVMKLETIETPDIAHFAYLLADQNEAAIVDPRRDIDVYLEAAWAAGASIRYIVETHRHEDFVMGSKALASVTGAQIVNGDHELFGHGDRRLSEGDEFTLGELTVRALHTPGHTPESMSYAVYAPQDAETAWAVFTGDALFFGTTGRTDLPDADKAVDNAALLYDSVHDKLLPLGDTTLVLPAHGPGSVCGSGMATRPLSTIGAEKRYNDVFTLEREAFAARKGGERLPRPPYFRHMEKVNLEGGLACSRQPHAVELLDADEFASRSGQELIYDTREPEAYAGGHVPGSHSIWLGGLPDFGGWLGRDDSPIYLVTDRNEDVQPAALHLSRIGLDSVAAALSGGFGGWRKSGKLIETSGVITAQEVAENLESYQVLDVREADEYADGHIPGAENLYVGYLSAELDKLELARDETVVVACGVGHRGGVAVGLLLQHEFTDVRNLLGGMAAWQALGLPVE